MTTSKLAHNLATIQAELKGSQAQLLVVSKTRSADEIRALYQAGQRHFGENKVQELLEKDSALADLVDLKWHLIGHLQSNKVNKLKSISRLLAVHSVDSLSLLEKLIQTLPKSVGYFLQVNTSGEDEKSGFESTQQIQEAMAYLKRQNLQAQGLMTMGTIRTEDVAGEARRCFKNLIEIRDSLQLQQESRLQLSMGMSGDYLIARDMGSDWVRVGSKIFA